MKAGHVGNFTFGVVLQTRVPPATCHHPHPCIPRNTVDNGQQISKIQQKGASQGKTLDVTAATYINDYYRSIHHTIQYIPKQNYGWLVIIIVYYILGTYDNNITCSDLIGPAE